MGLRPVSGRSREFGGSGEPGGDACDRVRPRRSWLRSSEVRLDPAGPRASIRDVHTAISGSDVVVAIVGGTLLGMALTRPRLAWLERLDEDSRRSGEIVMTIFAFVIGGYAYGSLYLVLHRQLGGDVDKLLRGAGFILAVYAGFVHFEPFSHGVGWREIGSAILLYLAVALSAVLAGVIFVEYMLTGSVESWVTLVEIISAVASTGGIYVFVRRSRAAIGQFTRRCRSSRAASGVQRGSVGRDVENLLMGTASCIRRAARSKGSVTVGTYGVARQRDAAFRSTLASAGGRSRRPLCSTRSRAVCDCGDMGKAARNRARRKNEAAQEQQREAAREAAGGSCSSRTSPPSRTCSSSAPMLGETAVEELRRVAQSPGYGPLDRPRPSPPRRSRNDPQTAWAAFARSLELTDAAGCWIGDGATGSCHAMRSSGALPRCQPTTVHYGPRRSTPGSDTAS